MTLIDSNESSGVFDPVLCAGSSTWFDVPNTGSSVIANGQTLLGNGTGSATYGKVNASYLDLADSYPFTGIINVAGGGFITQRNTDSTCSTIGAVEAQQCWATDKDILYMADGSASVWFDPYKLQAVTVSSNGTGTPATFNLDPTSRYIEVTCNDTDGCDGTVQETSAKEARHVTIVNVTANRVRFSNVTNVLTLVAGTVRLDQFGVVQLVYEGTRWTEIGSGMHVGTTVPATCEVGDPLFFDTDAVAGARLQLCVATNTWLAIDNGFGSQINASELENTITLSSTQVIDANTNHADIRLATTSSDGTNEGSVYIDSTSNEPKWYAGGALRKLSDYFRMTGRPASQSVYGGDAGGSGYTLSIYSTKSTDGSDDGILYLQGGGADGSTRGARLSVTGNEAVGGFFGGQVFIDAGNVSAGGIIMRSGAGVTRLEVDNDGDICLAGVALNGCDRTLGIDGTAARNIGMLNHSTAASAGNNLTVNAGGSGTNSNLAGGDLILASGRATGNGAAKIDFQTVDANQGSGSSTRAAATRLRLRDGHVVALGTAPTASGCGTSPTIAGTDVAGRITIGTTPGTCVITFAKAFTTNAPACVVNNQTSAVTNRATSVGTSSFTISGTLTASDVIAWTCLGYE
jgi:hypothetical protein